MIQFPQSIIPAVCMIAGAAVGVVCDRAFSPGAAEMKFLRDRNKALREQNSTVRAELRKTAESTVELGKELKQARLKLEQEKLRAASLSVELKKVRNKLNRAYHRKKWNA